MHPGLPTGTVTFLFTDLEGSTNRWEHYPRQMRAALARHDDILRQAIGANHGYVFKTVGDAFCAAFHTPHDALSAALATQQTLFTEQWDESLGPVRVRMALHTGVVDEQSGDYFGPPVNRVARLLSAGHGGQTLMSAATQELVRDALPTGAELKDMGEHRLKDLVRPERIFQLLAADLPSEFAPLKTLDSRPNNLPLQPTSLVGREREIEAVVALLRRPDARLVTLTGAGGTGKTRLGLQAAADLLDDLELFEDGVYVVNLSPLTDPGLVVSTIAQTLGVNEVGGTPLIETLVGYLKEKRMLLVLDNFEQVVSAAPSIGEMLSVVPKLKVLVTSRAPLHLRGEKEYPVPSLSLPDARHLPSIERLTQYEAVRLFIERATDVKPDFEVTNDNAPAVAEICVRLDGLPLAIELAAARVRMLPPQALLARLSSRLRMLTGGARDLPARQQTLRNTIEWSYDLLTEGEQQLFKRMAVFQGGRTLEALEAVCNYDGQLEIDVLDGVGSLVSKSLLQQREGQNAEPRFVMLETIHEYAHEKLEESGEAAALAREHAAYFLRLAEEAESHLMGAKQIAWLEQLEGEHDNLRAALGWSTGGRGDVEIALRLSSALWRFWARHSHFTEARKWLEAALEAGSSAAVPLRAKALYGLGVMFKRQQRYVSAIPLFEEALSLFRQLGDKRMISWALNDLGSIAINLRDAEQGTALLEQSLALKRELGDKTDIAIALVNLGELARLNGEYERAAALGEESLDLCRQMGEAADRHLTGYALANLGYMEQRMGNNERAAAYLGESMTLLQPMGDKQAIAMCLAGFAGIAGSEGHPEKAARLFGAATGMLGVIEASLEPVDQMDYDRNLLFARAQLDEAAWEKAWAEGRAMSMEDAIAYALEKD